MNTHANATIAAAASVCAHHDAAQAARSFRPARSTATRAFAAMSALLITLGLVQAISTSFLSVPDAQLAKAASGKAAVLASGR